MGRPANLVVNILGNASDLQKALGTGGGALSGFGNLAANAGKTFAVAWTAVAAAAGATTVALFKQGVAYNTLQQQANAAFTTLLGSQQAAAQFMSDISAFAQTSPFPKQAFIQASQQMLAFGIQSQKIVPYLKAVQDAVAAAGGSSQQLSEVTFVMAQIQAAGKITGQDLIQFGQRGINAADLIGKSLGKTGAEIKASITAGTLDAGTALDALAEGMESTYAGAADNVKATWVGATDRIRGALRDIGSALAEPFVSAQGGGLGVTWANSLATILRGLIPIVQGVMTAITQAMGPTFQNLSNILDAIGSKLKGLDSSGIAGIVGQISGLGPALGALTGAFAAISGGLLSSIPVIGPLLAGLGGPIGIVAAALAGLIAMSPQLQQVFGGAIKSALQALAPTLPVLGTALKAIAGALTTVVAAAAPLIPILAGLLGSILSAIAPVIAQLATGLLPPLAAALTAIMPAISALVGAFTPLLDLLAPLVAAVLPPLVQILTMVLAAFQPIIPVVAQLATVVVGLISTALGPFLPVLGKLLSALVPIIQPILSIVSAVLSLLGPILQLISPILQLAAALAGALAGALGTVVNGALRLLGPILKGIADAFNWVAEAVQNVIHWFNSLKIPSWLSSVAGAISGGAVHASAPAALSSGVSWTAPLRYGTSPYARGFAMYGEAPAHLVAATPARPIQVVVTSPYQGDAIARTIRRELVKLDRRERGVVLRPVGS